MSKRIVLSLLALLCLFAPANISQGQTVIIDNYNYAASSSVTSPTSLSNLIAWYDASDAGTITDDGGGLVSSWLDKSGNGYHGSAGGGNRPTTGTRTINSLNALDCDGTSDSVGISDLVLPTTALTIIVVHLPDTTGTTTRRIISNRGSGGFVNRVHAANQATDFGATVLAKSSPTSGTAMVQVSRVSSGAGTTATQYLKIGSDAELSSSVTRSSNIPDAGTRICSYGSGTSDYYDGAVADVMVYGRMLTNSEVNSLMNNYVVPKWAVAWSNL